MHCTINDTCSSNTQRRGEQDWLQPAVRLEQNLINCLLKLSVMVMHKQPGFAYTFILQV